VWSGCRCCCRRAWTQRAPRLLALAAHPKPCTLAANQHLNVVGPRPPPHALPTLPMPPTPRTQSLRAKTQFSQVEIFRKYLWYMLRERTFDQVGRGAWGMGAAIPLAACSAAHTPTPRLVSTLSLSPHTPLWEPSRCCVKLTGRNCLRLLPVNPHPCPRTTQHPFLIEGSQCPATVN